MSAFFALLTVLLFAAVMGLPYERQDIEDSVQRLIKLYRDRHHSPLHKRNELPSKARYYNHSANIRAPNKYIIKLFKDTTVSEMDEFKLFISQLGWTIVYQMDADFPCFVVQTADGEQKVPMDLLERLPQIDIVEEDHKMVRLSVQKQPLDSSQWALDQMDNKAFPNDQNSYGMCNY